MARSINGAARALAPLRDRLEQRLLAAWPGPIWGVGQMEPYKDDEAAARVSELRLELER